MAIVKVKDLRKKDYALGNYVYYLLSTGRLPRNVIDGCLAYNEDDLAKYHSSTKRGRPLKDVKPKRKPIKGKFSRG